MPQQCTEEWDVLTGCISCIRKSVCEEIKSCVLLCINQDMIGASEKKRKLIYSIRAGTKGYTKPEDKITPPKLTRFEKLCIEAIRPTTKEEKVIEPKKKKVPPPKSKKDGSVLVEVVPTNQPLRYVITEEELLNENNFHED